LIFFTAVAWVAHKETFSRVACVSINVERAFMLTKSLISLQMAALGGGALMFRNGSILSGPVRECRSKLDNLNAADGQHRKWDFQAARSAKRKARGK